MALSPSIELATAERELLLAIARRAIDHMLEVGERITVSMEDLPASLHHRLGVFVTLSRKNRLRGCIGALESAEPLALAVADAAHGAAFRDPRFPSLQVGELQEVHIDISVLSALQSVAANSYSALLRQLQSGADGLLIQDGPHRATFLPKVWEQLPHSEAFLDQLWRKAGLPPGHWSPQLRCWRYRALSFGEAHPS